MIAWGNTPFAFAVSAVWTRPDTLQLTIVDPSLGWSASLLTVGGGSGASWTRLDCVCWLCVQDSDLIGTPVEIVGRLRIFNGSGGAYALPGSFVRMTGSFGAVSTPPKLASAAFNGAFTGLVLRFSKDTDQGSNARFSVTSPLCAQLLSASTLAAVGGADASCVWRSLSELEVVFGAAATVRPEPASARMTPSLSGADECR